MFIYFLGSTWPIEIGCGSSLSLLDWVYDLGQESFRFGPTWSWLLVIFWIESIDKTSTNLRFISAGFCRQYIGYSFWTWIRFILKIINTSIIEQISGTRVPWIRDTILSNVIKRKEKIKKLTEAHLQNPFS